MGPTLSKKEIASRIKDLRGGIGDAKDNIKAQFRSFAKVSKVYVKATAEYKKAKAAYDKKPKAKQERKLDVALDKFYQAHDDYKAVYKLIDSYFTTVEQNYNEMCDLLDMRGATRKMEKTTLEFERYRDWLERKLTIISENVPDLVEEDEQKTEEAPVDEYADAPIVEEEAPAPVEAPAPAAPVVPQVAVSPVSVSPVIIDMSSVVSDAVDNTIAKFNLLLDKKLREYFDNLTLSTDVTVATKVVKEVVEEAAPAAEAPVAETVETPVAETAEAPVAEEVALSPASVELQGEILTKEQEIYAKLKAMSEEVTAMLAALETISGKQKDLNGMQKQTNDTLRRIMRDQQGIQVSLRIVNQDQAEVNAQQAAVVENQKLVVEQQQALADAQNGMIETQSAVIATQSGLNDAMKAVMQAQKEILHTQNRIAQGNAKAQEAGKVLLEKQAELNELQKAVMANQRQVVKDYAESNPEAKPARTRKAKKAEEVVEAPVVEETPVETPAEEVTE